ncbi:MAG: hypothetical protein HY063_13340 [Bacteroidetes bacterium]|nr:hypothetical protein [Bacteroidota bacterium]
MQENILYMKNFPNHLRSLEPTAKGKWGKMNAQQMVEHLTDSTRVATGKEYQKKELTEELTEKARKFFLGDKPFRENTTNHLLPVQPNPVRNLSMENSIKEFETELNEFFSMFEDSQRTTINPFAGKFNFEQWVHLLHKHFQHHAKQFGLSEY